MISEPRPPVLIVEDPNDIPIRARQVRRERKKYMVYGGLSLALFICASWWFLHPPEELQGGKVVSIADDRPLSAMLIQLEGEGVIRSPLLARFFIMLYGDEREVASGEYFFAEGTWLPTVAKHLARGEHNIPIFKVTFPEGITNQEMAGILYTVFPQFDTRTFLVLAEPHEGYLFPNTYEFFATVRPEKVIDTLRGEFEDQIAPHRDAVDTSGRSISDIVIMASLLEGEAKNAEDRTTIAGILWKRLDKRMPLQVDATFVYLLGKGSLELTIEDLSIDSPYNTYRNKGLPPGAISNPGLDTILAALSPTPSPYWFYLSDRDGKMHYAKTFEEHKENKARYLR